MLDTGNEGIGLAKAAIAVLLSVLFIGAVMSLYFTFADRGSAKVDATVKDVKSANMEKLYALRDKSVTADNNTGAVSEHPLVSAVSAALLEHSEEDMLYIYVTCRQNVGGTVTYKASKLHTYNNVTFEPGVLNSLPGYSASVAPFYGDTILTKATQYMQQWAKERCHISLNQVPYGGSTLLGISVEILEE